MISRPNILALGVLLVAVSQAVAQGADPATGYRLLTEKPYLPADFDQDIFDRLHETWPEPHRSRATAAPLAERRRMIRDWYGLDARPDDPRERPLQYVVTEAGTWHMNCFACHGGSLGSRVIPGSPNRNYALQSLTADVRQTKLRLGKPLGHMDIGSLFMPLGTSRGTTNAVMFGVALLAYREPDLTLLRTRIPPAMTHHDMDAPPWWHFHRKRQLYIDGFAPKEVRPLMQFMLVEQNGPAEFQAWESDFAHVFAYLASLRPPAYPGPIDTEKATRGEAVFLARCAECHGTYGPQGEYPEKTVPWEVIRTDAVRLQALTPRHRERYAASWFAAGHHEQVLTNPQGYVAPPLDGLWASAPYLHNGSVPTVWHLLHPAERPRFWQRQDRELNESQLGLNIIPHHQRPASSSADFPPSDLFDTTAFGKSAAGHAFVDELAEEEKEDVLEYLKTL